MCLVVSRSVYILGSIIAACLALVLLATLFWRSEAIVLSPKKTIHTSDPVRQIAISSDGKLIVLASPVLSDTEIHIIDLRILCGTAINTDALPRGGAGIAISPDGATFAIGCDKGILQLWDTNTCSCRQTAVVGDGYVSVITFDPSGKYIYAAYQGGVCCVDANTGVAKNVIDAEYSLSISRRCLQHIDGIAVSPDGNDLVINSVIGTLVWDLHGARERFSASGAMSIAISPNCEQLAIANRDLEIVDFCTGTRLYKLPLDKERFDGDCLLLRFSPDGRMLAAGIRGAHGFPGHIAVWKVTDYSRPFVFGCHDDSITDVCFLPKTNIFVTGARDNTICFWNLDGIELKGH